MLESIVGSLVSFGPGIALRIALDGMVGEPAPRGEFVRFEDENRSPTSVEYRLTYSKWGTVRKMTRYIYAFAGYDDGNGIPDSYFFLKSAYELIDRDDKPNIVYFKEHYYGPCGEWLSTRLWQFAYKEKLAHLYGG